jgi:hypothetical protein
MNYLCSYPQILLPEIRIGMYIYMGIQKSISWDHGPYYINLAATYRKMRSSGDVGWSDGTGKRWNFVRKHLGAIPTKFNVSSPFTQPKLCDKTPH